MTTSISQGLPRPVEAAAALAVLIAASPALALIAVGIALTSSGPVLFRHQRVGKGGRQFTMLKFRTMHTGRVGPDVTAKADPRITPLGRILRKSKLDELPELWNIVRGDMSLVGPRPESTQYVDLSNALWREVLAARPGLTDPMTLRLRNEEELLAAVGADHEGFYRRYMVPYKLRGYRDYLSARTWKSDLSVIWSTALGVAFPKRLPPPSLTEIVASVEAA